MDDKKTSEVLMRDERVPTLVYTYGKVMTLQICIRRSSGLYTWSHIMWDLWFSRKPIEGSLLWSWIKMWELRRTCKRNLRSSYRSGERAFELQAALEGFHNNIKIIRLLSGIS